MKKIHLIVPVILLTVFSCRKSPDTEKLSSSFVVQTTKQPDANFGNYKTFYISDTIAFRSSNPLDTLWFGPDAQQLVDAVKSNMTARGYTLVPHGNRPDLGLGLTVIKDLNIGVIYPGWWWGYWGGCYWGYCGYPPYYPWYGGGIIYSVPTGTIVLDMIDLKNASHDEKLSVPWGSVMSGGLGSDATNIALGIEAINQAYTQSPYIQTN